MYILFKNPTQNSKLNNHKRNFEEPHPQWKWMAKSHIQILLKEGGGAIPH